MSDSTIFMGKSRKSQKTPEEALSKNHQRNIKYLARLAEELEAEEEIASYERTSTELDSVHQPHPRDTKPFL